jgi:RimJ/RimL family protein N-acetyltransferase
MEASMSTAMPVLETTRLLVRPLTLDDLEACHQLLDLEAWQTGEPLERRREWLEWTVRNYAALARLYQPPYGERAVVLRSMGELVGMVGLVPSIGPFQRLTACGGQLDADFNQPEFGLFWATRAAHLKRGYATEAARALIDYIFSALNARRVVAMTEHDNARSQAVMRRLGMTIERNPLPEPAWFQTVGVLARGATL